MPRPPDDLYAPRVLCLFGTKPLSADRRRRFAGEMVRALRPGGRCALIEVSIPPARLLLGDPASHRMPAEHTRRFRDSRSMVAALVEAGLEVKRTSAFLGCAHGARGRSPLP